MKYLLPLTILLIMSIFTIAQITEFPYQQGFENEIFPPEGWETYPIVAGDMEFQRVAEGEWPECLPHDGSEAMVQYRSFGASIGEEAVLISPEMILSEDNAVRFWFFRSEDPSNNRLDKIEVYYNDSPSLDGAVFLDSVNRAINFYPEVAFEDWYQYEFEFSSTGSTYIIIKAISAYGWNMFIDDFEIADELSDEDPPEAISLDGTTVYANQEMNLELRVRDISEMPDIIQGEYTINGQSQDLIMSKEENAEGDYLYHGTIPGYINHTTGIVKFFLEDIHGNSAWSMEYNLLWQWLKPLFEEGFEGEVFPPAGWTVTGEPLTWLTWNDYGMVYYTDSDNVEWEVYPPEGERQAAVEWDFQNNVQDEWLITPEISITENADLSFKTFARLYSYDYDEYFVSVSTDGFTWNTVWSAADYPVGVSNYDEDYVVSLNEYVGEDIRVAWRAYNSQGTNLWYSWFVDDVKIRKSDTLVVIASHQKSGTSSVFPNPFENSFNIHVTSEAGMNVVVAIYNCDGRMVFSRENVKLLDGENNITVDMPEVPAGIYYYTIVCDIQKYTGKIFKK
ncbi:MAG: hypothetical protein C0593_03285 [Marinilabiliales bacterium]|nr:MAG: hypothetical protein C0593_03285 [Marinilabiliales bacterium]